MKCNERKKNQTQKKSPPDISFKTVPKNAMARTTRLARLLIWAAPKKHNRILVAYERGADPQNPNNLVTVKIADNRNFVPGMRVSARQEKERIFTFVKTLPNFRQRGESPSTKIHMDASNSHHARNGGVKRTPQTPWLRMRLSGLSKLLHQLSPPLRWHWSHPSGATAGKSRLVSPRGVSWDVTLSKVGGGMWIRRSK